MQKKPQPSEFVRLLEPALDRAAKLAREHDGRVPNIPKLGEESEVKAALTIADSECQEILLECLLEHFPAVSLAAEEDTPSVGRFSDGGNAVVVIDPIDGTLHFFLGNSGSYSQIVGLAIDGRYEAALVGMPRERRTFEGVFGGGAWSIDADGKKRDATLNPDGRRILISHDLAKPAVAALTNAGYELQPASGGAISVAPLIPGICAGLRVATNQARDISIRGRVGVMIAAEAGASLRTVGGRPFPRDLAVPAPALLVAANAEHLETLEAALAAIDSD